MTGTDDGAVGTTYETPRRDPQPPATRPLLGVELLRFACTLPILLWHYQHFYIDGSLKTARQPLFDVLRPFYLYGHLAVWVFWCLSGFIFFWKYAHPINSNTVRFGRFVMLRFSRLYPLHLVTLLVVAVLAWRYELTVGHPFQYRLQDTKHFVLQMFMASNWTSSEASFNGPGWSVSVEVIVYLLFFALCRAGATRWWTLIPLALTANFIYEHHLTTNPIVLCFFMFYSGALVGCFHETLQHRTARARSLVLTGAFTILAFGTGLVAAGTIAPIRYVEYLTPLLVLVLVLALAHQRANRIGRSIEWLGNLTYSSYLWHFPIQLIVVLCFAHHPAAMPKNTVLFLLGYLVTVYIVAAFSYRFIERPAQIWLRRHTVKSPPKVVSGQTPPRVLTRA